MGSDNYDEYPAVLRHSPSSSSGADDMSDDRDCEIEDEMDQKSRPISVFRDLLAQWMPCDRVSYITLSVMLPSNQPTDASLRKLLEQEFSKLVNSLSQFAIKGIVGGLLFECCSVTNLI